MSTGVTVPALPPPSAALLESVLSLGGADPQVHRTACKLNTAAFDKAVADLIALGLVRLRRTDTGLRLQPGTEQAVQAFVKSGGLVPQQARRLVRSRQALRQVLRADDPGIGVERVTDPQALTVRVNDLTTRAREEAISVLAGPAPTDDTAEDSSIDQVMLERGVSVLQVRPMRHFESPAVRSSSEILIGAGGRVRFAGSAPHRMLILDRRTAVVTLDENSPRLGALLVTEELLVRSLHFLATALFRHATPYDEVAGASAGYEPTAVDRRVLALMSSGVTDRVAARDLGVTERQFRRYVAQVLEQLGASSRFQAGVRAYERGWL